MIAVLTDPAVGGTFLTWSLHYLAGHQQYYLAQNESYIDVPLDPLTDRNSHNFKPNQPSSLDSFNDIFNILLNCPTDDFHTIYFHNFKYSTESVNADQVVAVNRLVDKKVKIVVASNSKNSNLYNVCYTPRSDITWSWHNPDYKLTTPDDIFKDFVTHFFSDSMSAWGDTNLISYWDRREFIALNFKFDKTVHIEPNIDVAVDYYTVDTMELFNTFDVEVVDLFDYLDCPIDYSRWNHWINIYSNWRKKHYKRLQFMWYFDKIIDYVINGRNFDLSRFDLDLMQEATIQHELIYKHNLNLKTWQLEKFSNTKQLHQLLEPNIHNLSTCKFKTGN